MMFRTALFAACALGLAGCATTSEPADDDFPARPPAGTCNAAAAQSLVGQPATQALGEQVLARTTAKTLRWGPPNSAWTMDYRDDRANVRYDQSMVVTAITCG